MRKPNADFTWFVSGIGNAPGKRDLARGPFNKVPGFSSRERAQVEWL